MDGADPDGRRIHCQPGVEPAAKFPLQQKAVPCVTSKLSNSGVVKTPHRVRMLIGPIHVDLLVGEQTERKYTWYEVLDVNPVAT